METICGNIFIRQMGGTEGLEPGHRIDGHTHNFDHTSIFFTGTWRVRRWLPAVDAAGHQLTMPDGADAWVMMDDMQREAPFHILIVANCRHEFTYLGHTLPDWMERHIAGLPEQAAAAFRADHAKSLGRAWCVYSHRTPQGDVSQANTGWNAAHA